MKKNLLFISMLSVSLMAQAQHSNVFLNKGELFVGGNTSDVNKVGIKYSSIYIHGTALFDAGSAVTTEELSVMSLSGDFVSRVKSADPSQHVFVKYHKDGLGVARADMGALGYIWFANRDKTHVAIPRLSNRAGQLFNLGLAKKQTIKMESAKKDIHFIAMPSIYGAKGLPAGETDSIGSYIAFDPSVAIASLEVKPSVKGIASIEGKYAANRRLDVAFVKSMLTPNPGGNAGANISTWSETSGAVVRDIKLYDATATGLGGESNLLEDNGAAGKVYLLTGFTPTSRYLYADHMFFNVLARPENGSFTGWQGPIVDPLYEMQGGKGYFIAQDVLPTNDPLYAEVEARHNVAADERAVGGYIMGGREIFLDKMTGNTGKGKFNRFTKNGTMYSAAARPFIGESLGGANEKYEAFLKNSYGGPVTVALNAGMNFLGNPFTTPLDLSDFATVADNVVANLPTEWGNGTQYTVSPNKQADIRGTFWVVNNATLKYFERDGGRYYNFKANFWDAQKEGGTIDLQATSNYSVGPMQMFGLQASKALNLTIPVSKTTMANVKTTRTAAPRVDELLLQAVVMDNDGQEVSEDRMAVVLKDGASALSVDAFDSRKLITNTVENKSGKGAVVKNAAGDDTLPYAGIVYSKSRDGVALSTNVLPQTVTELPVYFQPTEKEALVRVKMYRQDTWDKIEKVWLEDKFENKIVEMTPDAEYVFTSTPLSSEMARENRFVLHFNKLSTDPGTPIEENAATITSYYNNGVLYLGGLTQEDVNSTVQIYDMQGRLAGQTIVKEAPSTTYVKPLVQGTYVLRVTGTRNHAAKFIVL